MNRLGHSGVNRLGDILAFVNTAGQLLLTRRGKTRMDGVGIVFEFYIQAFQMMGDIRVNNFTCIVYIPLNSMFVYLQY